MSSRRPRVPAPSRARDAHAEGVRLLAARELTAQAVASRLARLGFSEPEIAGALDRLRRDGALDDRRAARSLARRLQRTGRAPARVRQALDTAGIDGAVARDVMEQAFPEGGELEALERALARAVRRTSGSPSDVRRLGAALIRQGFDPEQVAEALRRRMANPQDE